MGADRVLPSERVAGRQSLRSSRSQNVFARHLASILREVTWKRTILVIVFTFNLRTFEFFPGGRFFEEIWFGLCALGLVIVLPLFKIRASWRFSGLELYLLLTMVVLNLLPAFSAHGVFGQPLIYGILAKRSVVLLVAWVLMINAWRRGWISERDLRLSLLFVVWFVTLLFAFMRAFLNPASFPGAPVGFILGVGQEQTFAVPGYLLPFGTLYYLLQALRERRVLPIVFGLVIFFVSTGSSWRALSLSITVTLLLFLFLWRPAASAILLLLRVGVVALAAVAIANVARPDAVRSIITHFIEAFGVATGKGFGADASANARIDETDTALPYVREHPVTGAGVLSVQWNGGALGVLGTGFSDVDIGLLGMIFSYGTIGVLTGLYQYKFAIQAAIKRRRSQQSPLLDGAFGYVVFGAFFSLSTGLFVAYIESTVLFVVIAHELTRTGYSAPSLLPKRTAV